jgi:hypothetical protein
MALSGAGRRHMGFHFVVPINKRTHSCFDMKGDHACPYNSLTPVISTSMKTATSPTPHGVRNGLSQMPSRRNRSGQRSRQPGIAIYNMRQGEGIRYETLFRDETVGALDAANGMESVRMLGRAMDLGGFHQVIFICHTPLVWELADSILAVGGGSVVIGDRGAAVTIESPSRRH